MPPSVFTETYTHNIIRSDPGDPREHAESLEDVTREEIPARSDDKERKEESFTAHPSAITNASVFLMMESVEECTIDKVGGPD